MAGLFHSFIYEPIYNALAFIVSVVPGGDIGIGIVGITLLVRLILFPVSLAAIRTQIAMREIDPKLKALRAELKDNKDELARRTMTLFKDNKINPFASFLLIFIQLPVIIGLYAVLRSESKSVTFDPTLLYSFIHAPMNASLIFLGVINLAEKSIILALIVGATQFIYGRLIAPKIAAKSGGAASFQDDLAQSMNLQMRYVFPLMLAGIAYYASAAIALYFVVSNCFSIGQELFVRKIHNGKR